MAGPGGHLGSRRASHLLGPARRIGAGGGPSARRQDGPRRGTDRLHGRAIVRLRRGPVGDLASRRGRRSALSHPPRARAGIRARRDDSGHRHRLVGIRRSAPPPLRGERYSIPPRRRHRCRPGAAATNRAGPTSHDPLHQRDDGPAERCGHHPRQYRGTDQVFGGSLGVGSGRPHPPHPPPSPHPRHRQHHRLRTVERRPVRHAPLVRRRPGRRPPHRRRPHPVHGGSHHLSPAHRPPRPGVR